MLLRCDLEHRLTELGMGGKIKNYAKKSFSFEKRKFQWQWQLQIRLRLPLAMHPIRKRGENARPCDIKVLLHCH
jgi:hypothetical protein